MTNPLGVKNFDFYLPLRTKLQKKFGGKWCLCPGEYGISGVLNTMVMSELTQLVDGEVLLIYLGL
jgi:hypothetical protein